MQSNPRILAFDPGYERLGVAVVQKEKGKEVLLYSDCVRTSATLSFPERLGVLGSAVEALITKWQPTAVALEDIYFAKNAKTAMQVAEVRGMLSYLTISHHLALFQYTPLQVKVAMTGYGQSDKAAVTMMVQRLVAVPSGKKLDDEMDAIAVGLTCLAYERSLR